MATHIHVASGRPFLTGAIPSPKHKLLSAFPHVVIEAPPPQSAFCPEQLNIWGNDRHGDCVSAEEAFAKACHEPEIFIPEQTVIDWAQAGGYLEGADLTSVMDSMRQKGFVIGSQTYDDGPYTSVDYSNETTLQSAISQGPVKVGMDANALPSGAGNQQGWTASGGRQGQYSNEDHCCSLAGYGPVQWLVQQLMAVYGGNITVPAGFPANGYLFYTWATLGIVDHAWIMSTVGEAWLRNPTTVGVPPLPDPTPTPEPWIFDPATGIVTPAA